MAIRDLINCQAVTPAEIIPDALISIQDGTITAVRAAAGVAPAGAIDLGGRTVLPGFIDLHIHGAGGADAHAGEIAPLAAFLPRCGVTAFLPTLAADEERRTLAALRAIAAASAHQVPASGAQILGAHLEGPFLNPQRAGAIPPHYMHPGDPERLARLLAVAPGLVRLMTIAPDVPGVLELIPLLVAANIVPSIGHTAADYDLVRQAVAAGAQHTTHLFNAMAGINHRVPGTAGAALADERLTVELIADGYHVHPAILAMAAHAKGPGHFALVSDAVGPAGLPPGEYAWLDKQVSSDGQTVRLADGTLAGSLGTLDRALRTMTTPQPFGAGLPLAVVSAALSTVPARILGLTDRGALQAGSIADLVVIDAENNVQQTYIAGELVYNAVA